MLGWVEVCDSGENDSWNDTYEGFGDGGTVELRSIAAICGSRESRRRKTLRRVSIISSSFPKQIVSIWYFQHSYFQP